MADNFIEKRMRELDGGKTVIRKANPSLDSLLTRIRETDGPTDESYTVKAAQFEAVIRSAALVRGECRAEYDEQTSVIHLYGSDRLLLGQKVLAMELKAAELKLGCRVISCGEGKLGLELFR